MKPHTKVVITGYGHRSYNKEGLPIDTMPELVGQTAYIEMVVEEKGKKLYHLSGLPKKVFNEEQVVEAVIKKEELGKPEIPAGSFNAAEELKNLPDRLYPGESLPEFPHPTPDDVFRYEEPAKTKIVKIEQNIDDERKG